ncbi:hypothetical protein LP420_36100 [Massilia sp. B-10]|nr:hypothetical protein LP420_36100 [Massilia sp. B-10]
MGRNLAWIRISSFGSSTAAELATALHTLDARGAPDGLILDLRNDPGGLVNAAAGVASAFLAPEQALFLVRGRGAEERIDVSMGRAAPQAAGIDGACRPGPARCRWWCWSMAPRPRPPNCWPGALQDHGRATVVGSRTFGKGSIQTVIPLTADSAVKMTVARYVTPLGREIQAQGLVPDVEVAGVGAEPLLREADLANHLPSAGRDTGGAYHGGGCEAVRQRAGQGPADGHCVPAAAGGAAQRD